MEKNSKTAEEPVHNTRSEKEEYKIQIVWRNVIQFSLLHLAALYGFYLMFSSANWRTSLFALLLEQVGFLGVTAGAHRLWSHRSYKARWPLRALLCLLNCIAFQGNIYEWCRDHRAHHKFTETDADPHNVKRGLFFAHIGWLLCRKHPDVAAKGRAVPMEDVWADPIVTFQRRFYAPLVLVFSFYLPTMAPVWWWGESAWNAFFIASMARYCVSMNITFLVNSAAHRFGDRPFNRHAEARENPLLALLTTGDGWHNFHHAFPSDYATSELGYTLNATKLFIDAMAAIGLAYDRKTTSRAAIEKRKLKYGDGTRAPTIHCCEPSTPRKRK